MPLISRYLPWLTKEHIQQNGVIVRWERAIKCPCVSDYGQTRLDCPVCRGKGYAYPEDKVRKIKGLLSGMQSSEPVEAAGLVKSGDMNFTPPPGYRLDDGDRITLLQFDRRESELVMRGFEDRDRLLQLEPIRIVMVHVLRDDEDGEPGLHEFPVTSYRLEAGAVVWEDGEDQPEPGEQYSVQYDFRPKYMVYRLNDPKYRGIQGKNIPQAVQLKYLAPHKREEVQP